MCCFSYFYRDCVSRYDCRSRLYSQRSIRLLDLARLAAKFSLGQFMQRSPNMPGPVEQPEQLGDIFESTLNLEDSHFQHGFEDGFRDGVEAGKVEGREVGLKAGFQLGEEIGFYRGCADIWKTAILKDCKLFSARSQRSIQLLEEQLKAYPLSNPGDERLQDMLEMIRARFRAILAMLSIHIQYDGYPKSSDEDGIMSF